MGDIFNLDNKFFQTLGKGVDCVCLSLLWMICCIPLAFGIYVAYVSKAIILALPCIILAVPAGIATTALYLNLWIYFMINQKACQFQTPVFYAFSDAGTRS